LAETAVNETGSKPAGTGPPAGWPALDVLGLTRLVVVLFEGLVVVAGEVDLLVVVLGVVVAEVDFGVVAAEVEVAVLAGAAGVVTVCFVAALLPPHAAKLSASRPADATASGAT
jgi:hypothetical protein